MHPLTNFKCLYHINSVITVWNFYIYTLFLYAIFKGVHSIPGCIMLTKKFLFDLNPNRRRNLDCSRNEMFIEMLIMIGVASQHQQ